jgi:ABC-type uncharacterized transport system substrate-binding protein
VRRPAAAALALALAPPAAAHPHIFVDASARFLMADADRLEAVRITHLYDPLVSLFVLQDLGFDPFAALAPEAAARLAAEQLALLRASNGFATLSIGALAAETAPVADVAASVEDGRMRVDFTLKLAEPVALDGLDARLAIYDPVYFIAFDLTDEVSVDGGEGCAAEALDWAPSPAMLALQSALAGIPADATPEDPTVGRLFAEEALLSCR